MYFLIVKQPKCHMHLRIAMAVAQHRVINSQKHYDISVLIHEVLSRLSELRYEELS